MKKETKNLIIKDLNRIEKEYNLKYYIDIFAELEKTCYKLHEKISFNEIEKDLYKNYELYTLLKESYKNIINQILRYILIDIIKLYIDTISSKRDQTEFLKLFWDDEKRKYIYNFSFSVDNERSRYEVFISGYYELKNSIYLSIELGAPGLYVENMKQLENFYNSVKESCLNYLDRINAAAVEKVKNNIMQLQKIAAAENKKIKNQIQESNKIINIFNLYNLSDFIKYKEL